MYHILAVSQTLVLFPTLNAAGLVQPQVYSGDFAKLTAYGSGEDYADTLTGTAKLFVWKIARLCQRGADTPCLRERESRNQ